MENQSHSTGRVPQLIMSITEHFSAAVRVRRKELNMSQKGLANLAGINWSHMGQIERGLKNASLPTIGRIAKALNCSPTQLLDYTHSNWARIFENTDDQYIKKIVELWTVYFYIGSTSIAKR